VYGEDVLTLWAIQNRLDALPNGLGDGTTPADCPVFFRPSFGRRGGSNSPQFGEFGFIILADRHLYLGETRWDGSSESIQDGRLLLRPAQTLRHKVFGFYVREWAFARHQSWNEFRETSTADLRELADKPIPSANSRLAQNLQVILGIIRRRYDLVPVVQNVLLHLYDSGISQELPTEASDDFRLVPVDYTEASVDGFVTIRL
jgi:hypothetical protein